MAFAPEDIFAQLTTKPTITWTDNLPGDASVPITSTGFSSSSTFNPIPGDGREQYGFTGTFFSTVDAQTFGGNTGTFGPANVWMVEPSSTTLSDWLGIDSLTRVANGNGWDYTINMRFGSDTTSETQGNIPNPPQSPPWDAYPFVTETGTSQDVTGAFRLNNFPGYVAPTGLADLLQIFGASDTSEATNGKGVPDSGNTVMLLAVGLGALAVARQRVIAVRRQV
jgi:hypothetical protein